MAPLAHYLRGAGVRVEAYDSRFTEPVRTQLCNCGVEILDEPIPRRKPDYIVYSSAVAKESEVFKQVEKLGIKSYRRGDFISKLFDRKRVIAVVGSHGKTSVTGQIVWALQQIGFEASYLVGARFKNSALKPGHYCNSKWVVLEVDESDGSINSYKPWVTVALNCDWDHVDRYEDRQSFAHTLTDLFQSTRNAVVYGNSKLLAGIASKQKRVRCHPFPVNEDPGDFQQSNRQAVITLGRVLGLDFGGLNFQEFPGMERRQSVLFESDCRTIIEDYAHHPTEIAALLDFCSQKSPQRKMKVIFQPHRYSRTSALGSSFADELSRADELHLLQTYAAFEQFKDSGTIESILGYLPPRLRKSSRIYKSFFDLKSALGLQPEEAGDQVLFVGAGDVTKWANAFAAWQIEHGNKADAFGRYVSAQISPLTILDENRALGSMTTMRVGGPTRWYAEPANTEDLQTLVEACELFDLPRSMIGRGSNLIVPDHGYNGLVLRLRGDYWSSIDLRAEDSLVVGAGTKLNEICKFACKKGLKGFEFLEGIPGTLGGALRMNAGAMGWEIFDLVDWVKFLMPDGTIQQIAGNELEIGYRYCREAYDGIALRAKLRAEGRAQYLEIRKVISQMSDKRRKNQPSQPSSGCVFRNPESVSAGWLIEQAGLKGEKVGGASISELHANFIVNQGGATTEEIIELIRRVRARVKSSHGVLLDPEVNMLGQEWKYYLS